jgi:hypothetical protein
VIAVTATFWFPRVALQRSLANLLVFVEDNNNDNAVTSFGSRAVNAATQFRLFLQWTEIGHAVAVVGALVTLSAQFVRQTSIDGLAGIDVDYCRALQQLSNIS